MAKLLRTFRLWWWRTFHASREMDEIHDELERLKAIVKESWNA
jgi:hypothetical protein